jgi:cysteinyl-tRNA synthetase
MTCELRIYNTLSRSIVPFAPIVDGEVRMYACGPTVYNYAHIGNLRTYVFEDLLRRTLELSGCRVNHVMNITDVGHLTSDADDGEDKIARSARKQNKTVWEIAEFYTKAFFHDTDRLGILRPTTTCKATDHISEMIALIQRIEKNGFTYSSGGNLYFDISKLPDYGKLKGQKLDELKAGARIMVDGNKRNPLDFVLWFTKSKFEDHAMLWDSPWGRGYPGWHIECSAMSMKYLGERIDIHCGGIDHISVHHTNEIAQSEAATGQPWVNYWVHAEFLITDREKMAKSAGNFLTLDSLVEKGYDPLDYRFFCLGAHDRSQLQFSWEALDTARNSRKSLNETLLRLRETSEKQDDLPATLPEWDAFQTHMTEDLNAPQALADLWGLVKNERISPAVRLAFADRMDGILGLGLSTLRRQTLDAGLEDKVNDLIRRRTEARAAKDWAAADRIRDELKSLGVVLEDTKDGVKWRAAVG